MSSLRIAVLLVLVGCGGSSADIPLADTFVAKDAATAGEGGSNSGEVGADAATPDADPASTDDAGDPGSDVADASSPPIADAAVDVVTAHDASQPVVDAAPPPFDSGPPACVPTDDKTACDFGGHTQGAYSSGIADDGCGSYYNCHAQTCGAKSNGPNDAGLPPTDQVKCAAGSVAGWEYSCVGSPDLMPSECVTVKAGVWCCPIPKNGKPFSEVLF